MFVINSKFFSQSSGSRWNLKSSNVKHLCGRLYEICKLCHRPHFSLYNETWIMLWVLCTDIVEPITKGHLMALCTKSVAGRWIQSVCTVGCMYLCTKSVAGRWIQSVCTVGCMYLLKNISICSVEIKWDGKKTKIWDDNEMRWIRTTVWNGGSVCLDLVKFSADAFVFCTLESWSCRFSILTCTDTSIWPKLAPHWLTDLWLWRQAVTSGVI